MVTDARTIPDGERLRTDVCVVGAGRTGIAVARLLAASGLEALLVEAGGFSPDKKIEALSCGEIVPLGREWIIPPIRLSTSVQSANRENSWA